MRALPLVLVGLVLAGCDGETGFTKSSDPPVTQEGTGEIDVQPAEIVISDIEWEQGIAKGQIVTVANLGDNILRVLDIGLSNNGGGALYCEEVGELDLPPGVSAEFSVIATLTTFEHVEGVLRIQSGDVDESTLNIPILAIPLGYEMPDDDTGDTGDGG